MSTKAPQNRRMARLESAAEKTARMLLRRKDIRIVVGSSPRYEWRTKTLHLPAYSQTNPDPRLEMAWRGLVDHECSHVEYSDFKELDIAIVRWEKDKDFDAKRLMHLTNVFEDIWIERSWGILYPGAVRHFQIKNEYLVEHNGGADVCNPEYIIPETGTPIGMWGAFTQAVLRVARGNVMTHDCAESVQELMAECRDEILQGWSANSTIEVIAAAEALWVKLKDMVEEEEPPPPPEDPTAAGGEDGEDGSGSGSGPGAGEEDGSSAAGGGDGEEAGSGEGADEDEDSHGAGGSGGGGERSHAANAIGGAWGAIKADSDVIASKYAKDMPPMYTVSPDGLNQDKVITFNADQRASGREMLGSLKAAAGPSVTQLMSLLRGAVAASTQSRTIGGMEEGDDLDQDALAGIALGLPNPAIFQTKIRQIQESTFVSILVDCSGSMGSSNVSHTCTRTAKHACGRGRRCSVCGAPSEAATTSKAGYAAITAMALHEALQGVRIPHAVLGYSTRGRHGAGANSPRIGNPDYLTWSRTCGREDLVFVPAPGLHDDGAAIPYITGRNANLDGESVVWGAKYAAQHGGTKDRVILIVIADGLPAGADDYRIEGPNLRDSVDRICHAGIEVYGIGVGIRDMKTFRTYYPECNVTASRAPSGSIEIKSGEGLTSNVLRSLTAMLTRGYGMSRRGR